MITGKHFAKWKWIPVIFFSTLFLSSCGFYSSGSALKSSRNGKLDLSKSGLTEIPDYVFKLTELRVLNLHDNKITKIPDGIGNLVNLEKLIVSRNDLTYISPEIGKLINLKKLSLKANKLNTLPS
jgi:hypothetical protein